MCCFLAIVISSSITHFFLPYSHHSHKWASVMDELVHKMLRKHMAELVNILEGNSSPSQPPPPSRPSPTLLWPFVMKELLSKTTPYGTTPPPSPEPEDWNSELIDLPPPPPPPPLVRRPYHYAFAIEAANSVSSRTIPRSMQHASNV